MVVKFFSGLDTEIIAVHCVLLSFFGSDKNSNNFMQENLTNCSRMLNILNKHGKMSPQNVERSFEYRLYCELTSSARNTIIFDILMHLSESNIAKRLIRTKLKHSSFNDDYWKFFALLVREVCLSFLLLKKWLKNMKDPFIYVIIPL